MSDNKPLPKGLRQESTGSSALWLVPLGLILLLSFAYFPKILSGLGYGDTAEFQSEFVLLGVSHQPGFQIFTLVGKVFSVLAFGPSVAWRANFMASVFGILSCLALYGAVRRITGQFLCGIIAATTLCFSTVFWYHSLAAEVYVFYTTFIVFGIYSLSRFLQGDKSLWVYLAAVSFGVAIGDRPSELFIFPGVVALLIYFRKKVRWNWRRIILSALLLILPYVFSVACIIINSDPSRLSARDKALLVQISGKPSEFYPYNANDKTAFEKLRGAVRFSLCRAWTQKAGFKLENMNKTIKRYGWAVSGLGLWGLDYFPDDPTWSEQVGGLSIGPLGVLLAIAGTVLWRKRLGWVLLGWGFVVGNLVFLLWHYAADNMSFSLPGLTGFALLAGLGSSVHCDWQKFSKSKRALAFKIACLAVPLFLLLSNWKYMDRNTPQWQQRAEYYSKFAATDWPLDSAVLRGNLYQTCNRYLFYVEMHRPDVALVYPNQAFPHSVKYFLEQKRPTFVFHDYLPPDRKIFFARFTPKPIAELGFLLINPETLPSDWQEKLNKATK